MLCMYVYRADACAAVPPAAVAPGPIADADADAGAGASGET